MPQRLLLISTSPEFPLLHFVLTEGHFVLGRSSKCKFVVNHSSVSRQHAEITVAQGTVTVRDRNSRNGVYVDESPISSATVEVGQRLRFGKIAFTLANPRTPPPHADSAVLTDSVSIVSERAPDPVERASLSPAQNRVLDLITDGLSEKEIAARLSLSPHTVHNHIRAIFQVFDVHSRPELLAKLLK